MLARLRKPAFWTGVAVGVMSQIVVVRPLTAVFVCASAALLAAAGLIVPRRGYRLAGGTIALLLAAQAALALGRAATRRHDELLRRAFTIDGRRAVERAPSLTLLSLHPYPDRAPAGPAEHFHDYAILGRTTITAAEDRHRLLDAIYDSIVADDGAVACFWPRHGLRVEGDIPLDLLICFECDRGVTFVNGGRRGFAVRRSGAPVLDGMLDAAGVPRHEAP